MVQVFLKFAGRNHVKLWVLIPVAGIPFSLHFCHAGSFRWTLNCISTFQKIINAYDSYCSPLRLLLFENNSFARWHFAFGETDSPRHVDSNGGWCNLFKRLKCVIRKTSACHLLNHAHRKRFFPSVGQVEFSIPPYDWTVSCFRSKV